MPLLKMKHRTRFILPEKCLLLDYFDGTHIKYVNDITISGIEPTGILSIPKNKNLDNGSEFFDLSKSDFNELPCGLFDEKTYNERRYTGFEKFIDDGLTLEFFSRLENNNSWVHNWCVINPYPFTQIMRTYSNNSFFTGYTKNARYTWDNTTRYVNTNFIGKNNGLNSWHHYAFTFQKENIQNNWVRMKLYIDGVYFLNYAIDPLKTLMILGSVRDANNMGSIKTGLHQMAKLIVWNYVKYTENFSPTNTLEGFI